MRPNHLHCTVRRLLLAATTATTVAATGCSDVDLYIPPLLLSHPLDNKISLSGGFCAEGAGDVEAFLKIMLIIDRSNSMNVTDRNNQRISAARDLVMRFVDDPVTLELRGGVEFAILSFFGDVVVHSRDSRGLPGFSRDGPQILFSIQQIAQTSSNTGYDKALAQAFLMLDADMARIGDNARALSRYETIFLSDGMPFPDNCRGEANSPSAAIAAVERIQALQIFHKVEHTFHTAFASDPRMFTSGNDDDSACRFPDEIEATHNDSLGQETRALLQRMAGAGDGTFTQFENGDSISFMGFEFADARRIYALTSFVASNLNARPSRDTMLADSDGDGLTDREEELLGSSEFLADSDGDGFSDALEWRFRLSGLDPVDPTDAPCDAVGRVDTDGDGLLDCEEGFSGTLRRSFDTDADGLPDNLELLSGTNASSAGPLQDAQSDMDSDGGSNRDEVRWHTDPVRDDVAYRSRLAYDYYQRELPVTTGQACYSFEVSNVTLASTQTASSDHTHDGVEESAGWNRIMLYMAQTPYDEPLGDPLYRVACVEARFLEDRDLKTPPSGRVSIPAKRPSSSHRPAPVLRPNRHTCHASVNQDCGLDTIWCRHEDDGSCQCFRPPGIGEDVDGVAIGDCPQCQNGIDDDGDGFTDYPFDPDCFDSMDDDEGSNDACFNRIDDDGDGFIDWPNDPGCTSAYDNDETDSVLPECADGIDNDNDGAVDFPAEPGCFAAADPTEAQSTTNPQPACDDGLDNDGDGLIDFGGAAGNDPGCADLSDVEEEGPAVCFYCERFSDTLPGQCDIGNGFCRPRSGIPAAGPCIDADDCRGGICDTDDGRCSSCLRDQDCPSGVCDERRGWCLSEALTPQTCTDDGDCPGSCISEIETCAVDPFVACRNDKDCVPGDVCSEERGFCLTPMFTPDQCVSQSACDTGGGGRCDEDLGWCLPTQETDQCIHDDLCPYGDCHPSGYCEQQTFVFPNDFDPEQDCLRAR